MHPMTGEEMGGHGGPLAGSEDIALFGDGERFWRVVGKRGGKMLSRGAGWDASGC